MSDPHDEGAEVSVSTANTPPEAPAGKRRWLPYAILVGVFVAGGATGAGVMRAQLQQQWQASLERPAPRRRFHLEAMARKLDLSTDQKERIGAILLEADTRRDDAVAPCRSNLKEAREAVEANIRTVLTSDQQILYDQMMQRMRSGRGRRGTRHRP